MLIISLWSSWRFLALSQTDAAVTRPVSSTRAPRPFEALATEAFMPEAKGSAKTAPRYH